MNKNIKIKLVICKLKVIGEWRKVSRPGFYLVLEQGQLRNIHRGEEGVGKAGECLNVEDICLSVACFIALHRGKTL